MNLIGISINHRTSPVGLREALHLSDNEIADLFPLLKDEVLKDGFVLSTCNRTEIFGFPASPEVSHNHLHNTLLKFKPVDEIAENHFQRFISYDSIEHIFRVASGLDSMMLGDGQILGQAKKAYHLSEDMGFAGSLLKKICDVAIKVGKRAISETAIGDGAVTISYAAVQLVEKIFSNLDTKKTLVIGAGETGELAVAHLKNKGAKDVCVVNRTLKRAEGLAAKHGLEVLEFGSFRERLHEFDIIISATSSDTPIVFYDDMAKAIKKRSGNPICITDIAIPRDFDNKVSKIPNVFYNDIDSLNIIVEQNIEKRRNEIPKVEKIIAEELENFHHWYNVLKVVPTIKQLRNYFEELRRDELKKIKNRIIEEDYDKVDDMTRRIMGRLLHYPTMKLRELAENDVETQESVNYSLILKDLYKLDDRQQDEF